MSSTQMIRSVKGQMWEVIILQTASPLGLLWLHRIKYKDTTLKIKVKKKQNIFQLSEHIGVTSQLALTIHC